VPTRTGKSRWDRSVIWGMLRNPAYSGRACFGKTMTTTDQPGLNRTARLAGRATPGSHSVTDRAREDWLEIAVPALVPEDTWARAQRRLANNKRYAARNSKVPSLLQGLTACSTCGYAYYRGHTTTTAGNTIYYYRCLGSDNYRYENGRVCDNKPVRADHLDNLVWNHITGLLADPTLIRAEIDRRLDQLRTADPTTATQQRLEQALAKASGSITRLIKAYQEELISLDELRARMPELRDRETSLRSQLDALATQLVDHENYLNSPPASKTSSPSSAATPTPPPSPSSSASCACWSKTSSSAPNASSSATPSPPTPAPHPPPPRPQTVTPTRSPHQVRHCVGGVRIPPWAVPVRVSSRSPVLVMTPAFRKAFTNARSRLSETRHRTRSSNAA